MCSFSMQYKLWHSSHNYFSQHFPILLLFTAPNPCGFYSCKSHDHQYSLFGGQRNPPPFFTSKKPQTIVWNPNCNLSFQVQKRKTVVYNCFSAFISPLLTAPNSLLCPQYGSLLQWSKSSEYGFSQLLKLQLNLLTQFDVII